MDNLPKKSWYLEVFTAFSFVKSETNHFFSTEPNEWFTHFVETTAVKRVNYKRAPDLGWFRAYSLFDPLCSVSVFKFCLHFSDNLSIASVPLLQWYVIVKENKWITSNFPDVTEYSWVLTLCRKIRRIKTQVKKLTFFQALHENSIKLSTKDRDIFIKVKRKKNSDWSTPINRWISAVIGKVQINILKHSSIFTM